MLRCWAASQSGRGDAPSSRGEVFAGKKKCSVNQQRHCWIGLQGPDIGQKQIGGAERPPTGEVVFQKGRQ